MIRKNLLFIIIFLLPLQIFAQFEVNNHIAGPSVGISFLGSTVQIGINHEYGISLQELGIDEIGKVGIGGIFRYWSYSENFTHVEWDYTDILVGIQSNYHFYIPNEKVDPWVGIVLAYNFASVDSNIKIPGYPVIEESNGGIWLAAHAGARYWLTKNLALNARIGFGTLSYGAIDFGVDYKFDSLD